MKLPESVLAGGPWLGLALVQVTLVAVLGLLAWLAARRGGSALRGAVLLAALVGLLVVPGLAAVAPVWLPLPEFAWLDGPDPEPADPALAAPTPLPPPAEVPAVRAVSRTEPPGILPPRLEEPVEELDDLFLPAENAEPAFAPSLPPLDTPPPVRRSEPLPRSWSLAGVAAVVWLLGALACLTRALARLALLYRWAWRARPVREEEWIACLRPLAERYGLPAVGLRESPAIGSPLTTGLFRPVILLPTARRTWSAEQRALILAHELAHVRRRDFLAGLIAELAACLCWFHPLVRWLAGRLRLEQEYTADAWAAAAADDSMNYVRCLARLALELGRGRGSLAPAFWRRRPEILRRIDMLRRNPHGQPARLGRATALTVAALAAAACMAIAGVGPLRSAVEDPKPAETAPEAKAPASADLHGDPLPAGARARLGTTRWRHGANITYVAFGADGQTLITAGQDNTVRLWDLATGKEIRRFARPKPAAVQPPPVRFPGAVPKKVPLDPEEARLEAAKAQLDAAKAQLEVLIRQQAKPAEANPPAKFPGAVPGKKVPPDVEKAQLEVEKAKDAAEKAKLAAEKAKLEVLQTRVRFPGQGDPNSFSVALAPDGKTLAAANANVIQLYEVETGKELRKIEGPAAGLAGLLFSPDGRTLAARGSDGALILWETATGKEMHQIKAPEQPANRVGVVVALRGGGDPSGLAFAPDGKTVAAVLMEYKEQSFTSSVKVWDVATGKETLQVKAPDGVGLAGVAFAPGGKILAYCANGVVHLCEAATGQEIRQIKAPDFATSLVFSPDGKALATRGRGQQVRVWETETGKELYQLGDADPAQPRGGAVAFAIRGATPEARNLAFSPDGKRIASTSGGTVRLWDAATGKELLSAGHQGPLSAITLSPDGKTVLSWGADRMIRRWEAATGKPLSAFPLPSGTQFVALAADGQTVALANADNTIRLVEATTGKELHKLAGPPNGTGALAFTPDGKVLAARGGDNSIRLYDVAKGSDLRQMAAQVTNNPLPGGVVVVNAIGRIGGAGYGAGLVFSPDGKLLASPGSAYSPGTRVPAGANLPPGARGPGGTIDLYDVTTGKSIRKIEPAQPVVSFAFSPDGRVLATENADQSITLWEVASGKERGQLGKVAVEQPPIAAPGGGAVFAIAGRMPSYAEPAGPVTLAFSPDGRALVARGPDRSVRVWDVDSAKEIGQFKGHEGRIETLAFAADGKTIATGSADTTILLWDAATLMKDLSKPALVELPDGAIEPLWGDLAGEDAGKAAHSVRQLAGAPKQAVPFLGERLKPAAPIDPRKVERWIADLESEKFAVRQEAIANLAKTGEQVIPALQKVLASQPTIETRKRVEELLDKLTGGALTAEQLRFVRAVEALERMAAPEAQQLLQTLAQGAPGALPTREAQAALDRLAGR